MKPRVTLAWAVIGKPSRLQAGKVLRGLSGQYGIYTTRFKAQADCPSYGTVERVRISVVREGKK